MSESEERDSSSTANNAFVIAVSTPAVFCVDLPTVSWCAYEVLRCMRLSHRNRTWQSYPFLGRVEVFMLALYSPCERQYYLKSMHSSAPGLHHYRFSQGVFSSLRDHNASACTSPSPQTWPPLHLTLCLQNSDLFSPASLYCWLCLGYWKSSLTMYLPLPEAGIIRTVFPRMLFICTTGTLFYSAVCNDFDWAGSNQLLEPH